MKSVLQGGWLLTVAFGNVIVLIVAEGAGLEQVRNGRSDQAGHSDVGRAERITFFLLNVTITYKMDILLLLEKILNFL